ncbi:helix-turn-helix transcriptional regulator [Roseomonas sp. BN140053]|uniref:helix-turn-helix transcriptional regulator n=1 Tax=Roseomonas sp. BN140053 TaxID=3391898 RepID=UPI0039E98553
MTIKHLNQTDLARRWCISPRTLERWRWLNQGPAYLKLGGSVAYRLEDVESYEAEQRRTTQAQAEQALSPAERFARGLPK